MAHTGITLYMASIIAKKKANQTYYYVVESARVEGKPRIVNQTYLGTAEKIAALIQEHAAPVPLSATTIDFGLSGALWLAAKQSGVFSVLESVWPAPRSGPSTAHYLLLAAIHRICQPGPKTEVADWYRRTILHSLWKFEPERFTSQAFWDCFERISTEPGHDQLEQAQTLLLGAWKQKQVVTRRLLAYDTTNFHTYIASSNARSQLAQRGHNKQGHHNLRQVGLSYVLDGESGISLCHNVYPGNLADAEVLPATLARITALLDRQQIDRKSVTLVLDKGSAALANTLELDQAQLGWISALPWNQAPEQLRGMDVEQLSPCGSAQPGVRVATERTIVHGKEYLCVLKYSASFAGEQLQSVSTSVSKVLQNLRRLSTDLSKPQARFTETGIRNKITRWLSDPFVREVIRFQLENKDGRFQLQFELNNRALQQLMTQRFGRTTLVTNRMNWTAEQVVSAYSDQQKIEQVFRGLKGGDWLGWGPLHHWTDSKIRIHAFYCMLGISLLQYLHRQSQPLWPGLSVEQLLEELSQIQQYQLLYPPQGQKGPNRVATVVSKQSLAQQALSSGLGLEDIRSTQRR
jgi:transposase